MTRAERVIAFIERYLRIPEGKDVGKPIRLKGFQKRFVVEIYDNPAGTRRAYLSVGRKNGKSALIACLVLAHLAGPEAKQNSQIISGARSREQAAIVYKLAEKMVNLNPDLRKIVRPIPSQKTLIGLVMNVEYRAISAEAGTAHGLSPIVAILDEVGQIKGPHDAFVEAIETAQGAHDAPLLFAISTQAPTDGDLFSIWLDAPADPHVVKHLYSAPADCGLSDRIAWSLANPAMGEFRSLADLEQMALRAEELPSTENSFRWLFLNQRIDASAPFVSRSVWQACATPVIDSFKGLPVFVGLDLSEVRDLTALVMIAKPDDRWHVKPTFWLPAEGLREKSKADRVPYDQWAKAGQLKTAPGRAIDYGYVAHYLRELFDELDIRQVAFDRWNFRHLAPYLLQVGFKPEQIEGDKAVFQPFGQGYASMSPALRSLEADLLERRIAHGGHPVLTMCAANAVVASDPAGNRKLDKAKASGRIDGMVALAMARAAAGTHVEKPKPTYRMMVLP